MNQLARVLKTVKNTDNGEDNDSLSSKKAQLFISEILYFYANKSHKATIMDPKYKQIESSFL